MRLPRVYCPQVGPEFHLEREEAQHLVRVLRLGVGDRFLAFDGSGQEVLAEILGTRPRVRARLLESRHPQVEPETAVTLYLALVKGERFDWAVEKATELGVSRLVPMATERTEVRVPGEERQRRWQRLATAAAAQSGRVRVPEVAAPLSFFRAIGEAARLERAVLLAPGGQPLAGPWGATLALLVGPEGGFSEAEHAAAASAGLATAGLGPRILRVETAALAALARVLQV